MIKTQNTAKKPWMRYIVLFLICLATMNVFNRYYYLVFIALAVYFIKLKGRIYFDIFPMLLLCLLGVSWLAFSPAAYFTLTGVLKPFSYLVCYFIGVGLLDQENSRHEDYSQYKLFYYTVIVCALGPLLHYLLNWVSNFGTADRNTVDIWTGTVIVATGQAALACIPLSVAVAFLLSDVNKKWKTISWIVFGIIVGYNLVLSGRTLFLMLIIVAGLAFAHKFLKEKRGRVSVVFWVVTVIVLFAVIYQSDFLGIRTYFEESPFYKRFFAYNSITDINEDGRMEKKLFHLENMHKYLWGGANIRDVKGYSHDIYLDTYDEAGILAFIGVTVYILTSVSRLLKCIRNNSLPFVFRQIVFCVYIAVYIEFMIEPILQGVPWLFATFCLIDGYVCRILYYNKTHRTKRID